MLIEVITISGELYINEAYNETYPEGANRFQSAAITVMDARTGFVLYENAQHDLMYPASVTKIMTALLVLEEISDLQEDLVFSEHSVLSLPIYASRMNMAAGDTITIYEALYGLMLPSGNDVANALAEHVSGDIETFVDLMNRRAIEIGALNTRFVNPCGLPGDGQHTTAYDMALIMQEALNHPVFIDIIAAPYFFIPPTENFPEGLTIHNTNLLIWCEGPYYNPWVVGGKTGFTNAAQHTLVSYARQGDHALIVSVLYAPRRATFTDTTALLDYAFSLPVKTIFESSAHYWEVPVIQYADGEADISETVLGTVNIVGNVDISLPMPENMPTIRYELYIPEALPPPVRRGDVVGYKNFYADDTLIGRVELISTDTIMHQVIAPRDRQETSTAVETANQPISVQFPLFSFDHMLISVSAFMIVMIFMLLRKRRIRRRRILLQRRKAARARYRRLVEQSMSGDYYEA